MSVITAESDYTVNLLNQYTSRTVPASVQINGAAAETAYVTVNNIPAERRGEFFSREFSVTNTISAVWSPVEVVTVLKNAGSNGADIVSAYSDQIGHSVRSFRTPSERSDAGCLSL